MIQRNANSGEGGNVTDENGHGAGVAHVPCLEGEVDSTGKNVGEKEQRETVAVESVQDLAGRVGDPGLLDLLALGAVQLGEHEHLDTAEEQKLGEVESADPADVGAVGHAAGDEQVRAVVPKAPHGEDEPDTGPLEEMDDGELGQGVEVGHRLFRTPVLGLLLLRGNNLLDLLFFLFIRADHGREPVGVIVHGVSGLAGGLDGVLCGLVVSGQDTLTGTHTSHEDGKVADERVDTLAVLRQEVARNTLGEDDVVLERSHVEENLVRDCNAESDTAVRRKPAQDGLEESKDRRQQGQSEEEVPVNAVLAFVLGVIEALDGGKTNKSKNSERERVAESSLHAGANGLLDLSEVFLELLTNGNNTSSKDEGANAEIHERRSESFSLTEATRENGKVDGKDAAASDDHHGTTVAGDERLDGERIPLLGLVILLGLLIGVLVLLCKYLIAFQLGSGLQKGSNRRQKKKTSKSLRRIGVDSGCTEDCAALQEEIHEQSLGTVRLEETLFLLQDTPDEHGNLWAVVRRYIAAAGMGRRAYRSQEGQDVDLPDATALQVGDGGLFLRLVVWRHFGECRRFNCCATCDKRKAGQEDLRSAAFSSGPVANARSQKPGEAGSTAGWGNLGEHWRMEEVWSATALPRAERDWRLETGRASRPHLVAFVLVLVLAHPPSALRRYCIPLRLGSTAPAVATSNTETCAMVETACCIVRATRGAIHVG